MKRAPETTIYDYRHFLRPLIQLLGLALAILALRFGLELYWKKGETSLFFPFVIGLTGLIWSHYRSLCRHSFELLEEELGHFDGEQTRHVAYRDITGIRALYVPFKGFYFELEVRGSQALVVYPFLGRVSHFFDVLGKKSRALVRDERYQRLMERMSTDEEKQKVLQESFVPQNYGMRFLLPMALWTALLVGANFCLEYFGLGVRQMEVLKTSATVHTFVFFFIVSLTWSLHLGLFRRDEQGRTLPLQGQYPRLIARYGLFYFFVLMFFFIFPLTKIQFRPLSTDAVVLQSLGEGQKDLLFYFDYRYRKLSGRYALKEGDYLLYQGKDKKVFVLKLEEKKPAFLGRQLASLEQMTDDYMGVSVDDFKSYAQGSLLGKVIAVRPKEQ